MSWLHTLPIKLCPKSCLTDFKSQCILKDEELLLLRIAKVMKVIFKKKKKIPVFLNKAVYKGTAMQ